MKKLILGLLILLGCEDSSPAAVQRYREDNIRCFWYKKYCFCVYYIYTGQANTASWTQVPDNLCEGRPQ